MSDEERVMSDELRREVRFYAATNHSGVRILFLLHGRHGVIQFLIFTHWSAEMATALPVPIPADVGYHSYTPMFDGQQSIDEACSFLEGQPCYYGGSTLQADEVWQLLITGGHEAMWDCLERFYRRTFDGSDEE